MREGWERKMKYKIYIQKREGGEVRLFKEGMEEGMVKRFMSSLDEWQRKSIIVVEEREGEVADPEEVIRARMEEEWYK